MIRPHCEDHVSTTWDCKPCVARYRRYRRRLGLDVPVRVGDRVTTKAALRG